MTRIVVDAATLEKLKGLTTPLELCDDKGHILARVNPVLDPGLWEVVGEEPTDEELAERLRYQGPTYSSDEVREMLRKR